MNHFVYILREINGKRTYVGYTVNLERRLRQHNGELSGGAKYTRGRKWEFAAYLSGFPNKIIALQCEWKIKHSHNKSGMNGRIEALQNIFLLEKLTSNSTILNNDLQLELKIKKEYNLILPENIKLCYFSEE